MLYPRRSFAYRAETEVILREVAAPEDLGIGEFELKPKYEGTNVDEIAELRDKPSLLKHRQLPAFTASRSARNRSERRRATTAAAR